MGFDEMTNYSKERMESLSEEIKRDKESYNSLVTDLESRINEMHNHWVEDPAAEAVYQQLLAQFNTFKTSMQEGYDTMTQFEQRVLTQVDRYTDAEQQTMNAING